MWPELPYKEWKDTLNTLHMWMQVIGKMKLELAPFLNQWWEVAFYVTATGLTSGAVPYKGEVFQADLDFTEHTLTIRTSWKKTVCLPLRPQAVADFYQTFMNTLGTLGVQVTIWPVPVEVQNPIPFDRDTQHASYDKKFVERWQHSLVDASIVFEEFRTSFRGKSSPVHFFWGSFDLSSARFSGKKVAPPEMKGTMGKIMRYAENEENFCFGFWPGDERFPEPAFYTYMYPKPPGMEALQLDDGASFHEQLGECILPYDIVRKSKEPRKTLLHFLESTYNESARLAGWDIESLRTDVPTIH